MEEELFDSSPYIEVDAEKVKSAIKVSIQNLFTSNLYLPSFPTKNIVQTLSLLEHSSGKY